MKRKLAIMIFALVGLGSARATSVEQAGTLQETSQKQDQSHTGVQPRLQAPHPAYQRRDTWYEFLLNQFNATNFDYGAWMEERRQILLNESVRNPYFEYSAGVTLVLLLTSIVCAKQWVDYRRTLWITAEMMADLYNHDHYSRENAAKAIRKYNDHFERCNRAIEANQNGGTGWTGDSDRDQLNAQLQKTASDVNDVTKERDSLKEELRRKSGVIVDLSLRVNALSKKNGSLLASEQPIDLSGADPNVMQLINDLQEKLHVERGKNKRLKGA
jgi:hypothetical protein